MANSERFERLMVVGNKFYRAALNYSGVEVTETKFIHVDKETGTYILANGTHPRVNTFQVTWKSIVFNDCAQCWFETPEEALAMLKGTIERDLAKVNAAITLK